MHRFPRTPVCAAAVLISLAGCTTASDTPSPSLNPTSNTAASISTPTAPPDTEAPVVIPGEESQSANYPTSTAQLLPTSAAITGSNQVSITYEGEGNDLQWHAMWTTAPESDGKGEALDIEGQYVLQITVAGVRYPEGNFDVPLEDSSGSSLIRDVNIQPPFEGMHLIFIGVDELAHYEVSIDESGHTLTVMFS
ncbi:hypothetical protein I6E29_07555 [Arcanobacterium haemolyticum]|nr:hypothetical protein [Arcanobacterium haemolyticum]